jgi:2-dehydro-3-deoxygalactonokinase
MNWRTDYIAVDWGTTNRRAYLVGASGEIVDRFEDDRGLLAVPEGGFEAEAAEIRTRLGDRPMLLAGMVGSNRGWREAPYAPCPAGPDDLAAAILWIEPQRTGIVPGVCQRRDAGADVMRGEEVQVIGAAARGLIPPDCLVCHPGTHAKWIRVRAGRIAAFRTMMTGELFALLSKHSILAPQLKGEATADEAFCHGARDGLAGQSLLAALFAIRARHLLDEQAGDPTSFASGLLIGGDVREGLRLHHTGPIVLMGRPDLCALYRAALAEAGRDAAEVDGQSAFLAGIHMLTELME